MCKRFIARCLFVAGVVFSVVAYGQTSTSSPFSQYGMGEITGLGTMNNWGAGKTGIGYSNPDAINFMNPASYSSIDTLTFICEVALGTKYYEISAGDQSASSVNNNFEYMNFSFPVCKFWGVALGIMPYSRVGYNYSINDILANGDSVTYKYYGSNGNNQFILGNSFQIAQKLSLGANVSYILGEAKHISLSEFSTSQVIEDTEITTTVNTGGVYFDFGAMYKHSITDNRYVELGVNYSFLQSLNFKEEREFITQSVYFPPSNTVEGTSEIPSKYGVGVSYTDKKRMTIVADYSMQDWSSVKVYNDKDKKYLTASSAINAGVIFHPDQYTARRYWRRISYRLGAYYETLNVQIIDKSSGVRYPVTDLGMTFGARCPFKGTRSTIDFAVRAGQKANASTDLLSERYLLFNIGIALNESWFYKRKYD